MPRNVEAQPTRVGATEKIEGRNRDKCDCESESDFRPCSPISLEHSRANPCVLVLECVGIVGIKRPPALRAAMLGEIGKIVFAREATHGCIV
jgi:hypothetical protein